eukprot:2637549-Pleurochrysis_carterae.AAC.1
MVKWKVERDILNGQVEGRARQIERCAAGGVGTPRRVHLHSCLCVRITRLPVIRTCVCVWFGRAEVRGRGRASPRARAIVCVRARVHVSKPKQGCTRACVRACVR